MSMPSIPEERYRPTHDEVVIDLLKPIAMEETALSHLIDAEASKLEAFVGRSKNFPLKPTVAQLIAFNAQVFKMIDVVVMKEWLLLRKLREVVELAALCDLDDTPGWYKE